MKSFSPPDVSQKSCYPQAGVVFIDGSKYATGTFLVSHKKALDFNNNIFSPEQTESPCGSTGRLGWPGHGAGQRGSVGLGAYRPRRGQQESPRQAREVPQGAEGGRREGEKQLFGADRNKGSTVAAVVCLPSPRRVLGWSLFPLR